ncbi:MAG: hypothetical protein R2715_03600 [Ilumatobacteraceae bacterium]
MAATELGLREQLVADWQRHTADGVVDVKILALHRQDIAYFNRTIHLLRQERGEVHGPAVIAGRSEFQVGDEVLTLRNHRRLGLTNGERGTITGIDAGTSDHHPDDRRQRVRRIPAEYLDDGHLTTATPAPIHKAQGLTTEIALVYGTEDLTERRLHGAQPSPHPYAALRDWQAARARSREPHASRPVTIEDEIIEYWTNVSRSEQMSIDLPTFPRLLADMPSLGL